VADRWGPEGPPPEAYERITNPERFAPLAGEVDIVVAALVAAYDVVAEPVTLPEPSVVRAVRLTPAAGAPLVLGVTAFPAVLAWRGAWSRVDTIPTCACDACDEDLESAVAMLRELAALAVEPFTEELTRDRISWRAEGRGGWSLLSRADHDALAATAPPGTLTWPAWPRRTASASGPPG
jgi:hypothetical protein